MGLFGRLGGMTPAMLRDLLLHKAYVDASMITAILGHEAAAKDPELRRLLHHILVANRYWLMLSMKRPVDHEREAPVPDSLQPLAVTYRETALLEQQWMADVQQSDLEQRLESPYIAGIFTVAQVLLQVCMHSHGHRSQCATRLRALGGTPPVLDFILWLKERPAAEWSL